MQSLGTDILEIIENMKEHVIESVKVNNDMIDGQGCEAIVIITSGLKNIDWKLTLNLELVEAVKDVK